MPVITSMSPDIGPSGPALRQQTDRQVSADPVQQQARETERDAALAQVSGTSPETLAALTPAERAGLRQIESSVATGFSRVYGSDGPAARGRVEQAAAAEGEAAFERLKADPGAFGHVADASLAGPLGDGLRGRAQMAEYLNAARAPGTATRDAERGAQTAERSSGGPDRQPSQDPEVDRITALVHDRLTRDIRHGDVAITVYDLREIQGELSRTTPERASQVVQNLSAEDLETWVAHINENPNLPLGIGGYTVPQQTGFYQDLARQLDAPGLLKFAEAMGDRQGNRTDFDGQILGRAISGFAPPDVRVAFAQEVLSGERRTALSGDRNVALATAEIIGGLRHSAPLLEEAFRGAPYETFQSVARAAVLDYGSEGIGGFPQVRYDAAPLGRMLDAVALNGSTPIRAHAFTAGAELMERIGRGEALQPEREGAEVNGAASIGQVRASMTRILYSDTTGVAQELDADVDTDGRALTTYFKEMIASGNASSIRGEIVRLQLGDVPSDDVAGTLSDRFGPEDAHPTVEQNGRAGALGHVAGALVAALDDRQASREERASRLSAILGLGASGVPIPGGGAGKVILAGLTERAARAIVDDYAAGDPGGENERTLRETVFDIARPRVSPSHFYRGESINNGPYETARNSGVAGANRDS